MATHSKRLTRLFKRSFGTDDIDAFIELFAALQTGAPIPQRAVDYIAGFGNYIDGLEEVFDQYDDRMKVALRNIEISSDELNAANAKLEHLNLTMNAMLESLGQGLFFFDAAGQCGDVYSRACETLLEGIPKGQDVASFLGLDDKARAKFDSLREIVFNPSSTAMSFDDLIAMAPQWYIHSAGRKIHLTYRPMYKAAYQIQAILVIASDVTKDIEVQEAIAAHEARAMRILRLVREKRGFYQFVDNLEGLLTMLPVATAGMLRHDLHTLKGQARFFYLEKAALNLHTLENDLERVAHDVAPLPGDLRERARQSMQAVLDEARHAESEIWGGEADMQNGSVNLSLAVLQDFGEKLSAIPGTQDLQDYFWKNIFSVPLAEMLRSFESQVHYYAERENCDIDLHMRIDPAIRVYPPRYQHVMDTLVHIARNLAVHAVEPAPIRHQRGKKKALQVDVSARLSDEGQMIHIDIRDDGCGVDIDVLRYRLKSHFPEKNVAQMSDAEIMNSIFEDDISTGDKITEASGRGVGLGALRVAVQKMGGSITVVSTLGQETIFSIALPLFTRAGAAA